MGEEAKNMAYFLFTTVHTPVIIIYMKIYFYPSQDFHPTVDSGSNSGSSSSNRSSCGWSFYWWYELKGGSMSSINPRKMCGKNRTTVVGIPVHEVDDERHITASLPLQFWNPAGHISRFSWTVGQEMSLYKDLFLFLGLVPSSLLPHHFSPPSLFLVLTSELFFLLCWKSLTCAFEASSHFASNFGKLESVLVIDCCKCLWFKTTGIYDLSISVG